MSSRPVDAPDTAPVGPADGASARTPRATPRRRAWLLLVGAAGLVTAVQWAVRTNARSAEPSGMTIHASPRELPALRFADASGTPTSLAAFRGRFVLLNVWATWCPPCREEMPTLDRLQASLGGPDFEVLTVSIDAQGLPVVRTFFKQIGIKHLHPYIDSLHEVGALGATGVPLTLLIDREGREVARKLGPATWDDPKVVQTIRGYLPARKNS